MRREASEVQGDAPLHDVYPAAVAFLEVSALRVDPVEHETQVRIEVPEVFLDEIVETSVLRAGLWEEVEDRLDASIDADTVKALVRSVLRDDDAADELQDRVVRTLIDQLGTDSDRVRPRVDLLMIAKHLERVADHATNIAESVVLVAEARNLKHAEKLSGKT